MDTVMDMVMATIEDTARGLLTLRLNLLLLPNLDTEDTVDMVDTDMDMVILDTAMDMVIDMARGRLMLRPVMDMAMDMAMEAMDMDTALDTAMVMVIDMARGLLMPRPAMVMVMDTAMVTVMDMAMDTVMDMAMDTDTMDKRTNQNKFHIEFNTKSSVSIS